MNKRRFAKLFWAWSMLLLIAFSATVSAKSAEESRAEVREQSKKAIERLYAASPSARDAIKGSAGYATFSNFGVKVGVAGGGKGKGLAVGSANNKEIFMRYVEVQAGVGIGIKKYDLIFIFDDAKAFDAFVNKGWVYGGQTTVAAKKGDKGKAYAGAVSVSPGVWLYQLTSAGLAAELTLKGSKYYKDTTLN